MSNNEFGVDASDERIASIVEQMTLDEKISLMSGRDFWSLRAIDRLDIPSLSVSDGPTGLRSTNSDPSTVFPIGTALAATWDPALVSEVTSAIGREAIAHGVDVLLAPGVNLHRTPLGGRNFEYLSEDPYLASEIGAAFVNGVQSEGVGSSVKHYAANNQEHERMTGSSDVGERPLRELYLKVFERIVRKSRPWTIMSAYNRINGVFCSENELLLKTLLQEEWGFDGVVVSDWGAVKSTAPSAKAGLNLEMPGPGGWYGEQLKKAIADGEVDETVIDDHAARLVRLIARCGLLDGNKKSKGAELNSDRHRSIARKAASDAIVLLKNDENTLPLKPGGSIAVIGGIADYPAIQGGGSSQVTPDRMISPLAALKEECNPATTIEYAKAIDHEPNPPIIDRRQLSVDESGETQGLLARYFDNADYAGTPVDERIEQHFAKIGFGEQAQTEDDLGFSVEWTGFFCPKVSGEHFFDIRHQNPEVELILDGEVLVGPGTPRTQEMLFMILALNNREAKVKLEAGKRYPITLRYAQPTEGAMKGFNIFNVALREPAPVREQAIQTAENADCALVFVGSGTTAETEGWDRKSMSLGEAQNQLVSDVAKVSQRTIVVVNTGAPVEMPWADEVDAIVQMWLPGQEGGYALSDVLTGAISPSGKLPTSFPKLYEDNPTYLHYPGGSHVEYGEGLFVGYRYYDAKDIEPLFPFGFGLSYTEFELSDLKCQSTIKADDNLTASVRIKNIGDRKGSETVQLYIEDHATKEIQVPRQLAAFAKVQLDPGEEKAINLSIEAQSFARYDIDSGSWVSDQGGYRLCVGNSSRNLTLHHDIELTER